MMTAFCCIILLKIWTMVPNFKIHSIFQYIAQFRSKGMTTKMALYLELVRMVGCEAGCAITPVNPPVIGYVSLANLR